MVLDYVQSENDSKTASEVLRESSYNGMWEKGLPIMMNPRKTYGQAIHYVPDLTLIHMTRFVGTITMDRYRDGWLTLPKSGLLTSLMLTSLREMRHSRIQVEMSNGMMISDTEGYYLACRNVVDGERVHERRYQCHALYVPIAYQGRGHIVTNSPNMDVYVAVLELPEGTNVHVTATYLARVYG